MTGNDRETPLLPHIHLLTKVLLALYEKQVDFERELIALMTDNVRAEFEKKCFRFEPKLLGFHY